MVSCISIGSVFARVEVDSETFDLWGAKAVWNKDAQTLNINGKGENGIVDKTKWEKLKETLSLREDVASAVRITFTDGARFPDDASSFFENVKGEISFRSAKPLDTSNVVNMRAMFAGTTFNRDISSRKTSNVTDMSYMFSGATVFNKPIGNWDTSKVTDMSYMFARATAFNQPIGNWDTSNVTTMAHMFDSLRVVPLPAPDNSRTLGSDLSSSFNQDISGWKTSNVKNMSFMFASAVHFDQDISRWDTSNVKNMSFMFASADEFNQDINRWNTSNVTDMTAMFCLAKTFNKPLGNWDTSKVTSMKDMFWWSSFDQNISKWNTSQVTDMSWMFERTPFNQDISKWDTSKVTDMSWMFFQARAFNQPLENWNVRKVTDMHDMFADAESFNQPLEKWDVSKVTDINYMFNGAINFDQDLSNWNPESLERGVGFIKDTVFSIENNDRLLKWWNDKLWSSPNTVTVDIDVPYCEGGEALGKLKKKNYNFVLRGGKNCDKVIYYLTKWKNKNLPITFEVDWSSDYVGDWNNFPEDFGLQITKEKINDNKTRVRISGVPQEVWKFKVIVRASGQKNKFRKEIALIVKKHKSQGDTVITLNTNEKPNDNWSKDTPKQETPVVDKYTRPLKKLPPKPKSLEDKKVFSDDEIFNPTIVNGQCYTRRPYLWIKDSATIITDEEFKKALSFLRTYEMTMFDSVDGYDPYRDLSREEAAKIFSNFAINVLCRKPDLNLKVNYSDVEDANPTLKPYITLAYQLGVMKGSGMGDGKFRPFDQISKAEVNAVLIRMILKSYLDESKSENKTWYSEYNKVATELGIIHRGAWVEKISRNNTALMLFRAYKQQVFEWRLIDYYSYVLQSRDLFVK